MKKLRRAFFFMMDQLQINRKERIVISGFLLLILILSGVNQWTDQKLNYNQAEYDRIMEEFSKRSRMIEEREREEARKYTVDTTESQEQEKPIININTAGLTDLVKLEGIGETYARRIIEYREENGPYQQIEDLLKVKGIGKIRLEKLAPFVKL